MRRWATYPSPKYFVVVSNKKAAAGKERERSSANKKVTARKCLPTPKSGEGRSLAFYSEHVLHSPYWDVLCSGECC